MAEMIRESQVNRPDGKLAMSKDMPRAAKKRVQERWLE